TWPGCNRSKTPLVNTTVLPAARQEAASRAASAVVMDAEIAPRSRTLALEADVLGKRPAMARPIDADVMRARFDAERVEQPVMVVRVAVALVDRDIELVGPFDEIEPVDRESALGIARQSLRRHLFEIGVRAVAADAVRVEEADAKHEIVGLLRR